MNTQNHETVTQLDLYGALETPLTRVLRDGVAVCSQQELLAVLLWLPHAERIADDLLATYSTLDRLRNASVLELARVRGLGMRSAARLKAALEAGRRSAFAPTDVRPPIKTPADAAALLIPLMSGLEQEELRVMMLTVKNAVLGIPLLYRGSINTIGMRVAEVYREAIRHNAASIIVAHNHPSFSVEVSSDDIAATKTLVAAGKLLDVQCLDHMIIAGEQWVSLKEKRLGFE
jgi:DNA repair protein RadC